MAVWCDFHVLRHCILFWPVRARIQCRLESAAGVAGFNCTVDDAMDAVVHTLVGIGQLYRICSLLSYKAESGVRSVCGCGCGCACGCGCGCGCVCSKMTTN